MLLKWLLKKKAVNDNRFFMRTAQTDEKYYHCLSCDYAWPGSCPSPCGKCHSTNVTQCSEIVYINCVKRCLQDKKL